MNLRRIFNIIINIVLKAALLWGFVGWYHVATKSATILDNICASYLVIRIGIYFGDKILDKHYNSPPGTRPGE